MAIISGDDAAAMGQQTVASGMDARNVYDPGAYHAPPTATPPTQSPLAAFGQWAGNVGHQAANVAGQVGKFIGDNANPMDLVHDITNNATIGQRGNDITAQTAYIGSQMKAVSRMYAAGQITKDQWVASNKLAQSRLGDAATKLQGVTDSYAGYGKVAADYAKPAAAAATVAAQFIPGVDVGVDTALGGLAAKSGVQGLAGKAASAVVKGAGDLVGAGKQMGGNVVTGTAGKLIKNASIVQPTVQAPGQIAGQLQSGDYGGAALNAGLMAGGPLAAKLLPKALNYAKGLFRSDQSFANTLQFQDGTIHSVLSNLQAKAASGDQAAAKQYATLSDQAKVAFDHMNAEGRTPTQIAQYEAAHSNPTEGRTVQDWLQTQHDMATAHGIVQANADKFMVNGKGAPVPAAMKAQLGVGKFDQPEKADLIQRLSTVSTPAERGAIIAADQKAGLAYTQNSNVMKAVYAAATEGDAGLMAKGIHDIRGTRALTIGKAGVNPADAVSAKVSKALATPAPSSTAYDASNPMMAMKKGAMGTLPKELQGAKPTYNHGDKAFELNFPNDTTKALYIVAGAKTSAREADYLAFLRKQLPGKTDAQLKAMGVEVKASIKAQAKVSDPGKLSVANHLAVGQVTPISAAKAKAIVQHSNDAARAASDHAKFPEVFKNPTAVETPLPKLPGGYIPIIRPAAAAGFKQAGEISNDVLTPGRGALAGVTDTLRKAGLSTTAVDSKDISATLNANFRDALESRGIKANSDSLLASLNKAAGQSVGAFDARALSLGKIEAVMGSTLPGVSPKTIRQAFTEAMANLPKEQVGLGQKVLNNTLSRSPLFNKYMRMQGIGKFQANPIFWAKQTIKSALVAGAEGAKVGVFGSAEDRIALNDAKLLSAKGTHGGDISVGSELGSPSDNMMRKDQQMITTWLAASIAKANNTTVKAIIDEKGALYDQMKQSLSLTHSYGKGGYLNSPMAKTLNLMIFPSRFTTKVALEAGKAFSKLQPIEQAGVIHALGNGATWVNSPDGKQWQKDNSELLGLIKYMTPLGEIDNVSHFLNNGFHAGDLGQIGGMPLGVITQFLEGQGVKLGQLGSSQGYDGKGNPYVDKIPQNARARIQQGLTDLIGSMYSYPGRQAGLESKSKFTQALSGGLLKPKTGDFKYELKDGSAPPAPVSTNPTPKPLPAPGTSTYHDRANLTPLPRILRGSVSASKAPRAKASKVVPVSAQLPRITANRSLGN
jgi:hypothetical protein